MINKITYRKHYVRPMISTIAMSSCNLLLDSDDKDLPFDPGDGTGEALAPELHDEWDWDDDNWKNNLW